MISKFLYSVNPIVLYDPVNEQMHQAECHTSVIRPNICCEQHHQEKDGALQREKHTCGMAEEALDQCHPFVVWRAEVAKLALCLIICCLAFAFGVLGSPIGDPVHKI